MADNLSRYAEGTFKNFIIHRVRSQDVEKLCQHVKDYFLHDEPTSKLIGYSDEYGEEFCKLFKHALSDNLSFWMEDTETGEVAALRGTFVHRKDDNVLKSFPVKTPVMKIMYRMSQIGSDQVNLYEKYGISEYANLLIASCAPKYRNQGLSKELYKRSLALLKAEGLPLAKSMFTSPYSRAAAKGLGFEELCRVDYKELCDTDGKLIFDPEKLTNEHFAAVMVKLL